MSIEEIERKYAAYLIKKGSVALLPSEVAISILKEIKDTSLCFKGVEAFKLYKDGKIQPSMDFSNISYGRIEGGKEKKFFKLNLRPKSPWNKDRDIIENTCKLIAEGAESGYSWYEIYVVDGDSNRSLFKEQ